MSAKPRKNRRARTFRCTDEEWEIISKAVDQSGTSLSDFIVDTVLGVIRSEMTGAAANDRGHPLVLTPETQEKMARAIYLLATDKQWALNEAGQTERLDEVTAVAGDVMDGTQRRSGG